MYLESPCLLAFSPQMPTHLRPVGHVPPFLPQSKMSPSQGAVLVPLVCDLLMTFQLFHLEHWIFWGALLDPHTNIHHHGVDTWIIVFRLLFHFPLRVSSEGIQSYSSSSNVSASRSPARWTEGWVTMSGHRGPSQSWPGALDGHESKWGGNSERQKKKNYRVGRIR